MASLILASVHEPTEITQGFKAIQGFPGIIRERFESLGDLWRFMAPMRVQCWRSKLLMNWKPAPLSRLRPMLDMGRTQA